MPAKACKSCSRRWSGRTVVALVATLLAVAAAEALLIGSLLLAWGRFVESRADPRDAIGYLTTGCTAEFVGSQLLMTAAHCVDVGGFFSTTYPLGQEFEAVFTARDGRKSRLQAKLVWVSALTPAARERSELARALVDEDDGLDLAFLTTRDRWPYVLSFGGDPRPGSRVRSISMALGIQYWTVDLTVVGVHEVDGLGRVVVTRGDAAPGASGSVLLQRGRVVGMITHGTRGLLFPPVFVGATSSRIQAGLDDYTRKGSMVICGWKVVIRRAYRYSWPERQPVICRVAP